MRAHSALRTEEATNASVPRFTRTVRILILSLLLPAAVMLLSVAALAQEYQLGKPLINLRDAGYYLWQDRAGWHVVTVSGGQARSFSGDIRVINGIIEEVRPVDSGMRDEDITLLDGHTITFSYQTKKDLVGFDFTDRGDSPCVVFNLKIDSRAVERGIFLGKEKLMPIQIPFSICK